MGSALFGDFYRGRRVLVTGHTGFKGSWLVYWLRRLGARVSTLALPAEAGLSHHAVLADWLAQAPEDLPPVEHESLIDLRDARAVTQAVQQAQPEVIFHLAAQALVRQSYADAPGTFATNVMGLVNVLEAVRQCDSVQVVLNVTTDKCYENVGSPVAYVESDKLGGHDPYSASKACAELVTASYRRSFFEAGPQHAVPVALATARAGNVIGGGDWSTDRLVPDLMRAAAQQAITPIRQPGSTRPWQHVLEPLSAYLHLAHQLWLAPAAHSRAWNFGPDAQAHLSVASVVDMLAMHWPAIACEIDTRDHPHEAALLHLNCQAAHEALNWSPVWRAATMAEKTANWYRAWYESGQVLTASQLDGFVRDARLARKAWAS
jgi:CDP-glucose 4,6-dehydratase